MAQNSHFETVRITGRSNNRTQHAIGCEYLNIDLEAGQLKIQCTAGVRSELRDQFLATCNGKPPCSKNAFIHTVREITHRDAFSGGIFADEFRYRDPQEWTGESLKTIEDATESNMVEVIAESSF